MDIIHGISSLSRDCPQAVVAIGVFDGVHRGHQKLIHSAVRQARAISGTAVVMTFFPHPVHVLHPQKRLPLLVSLEHRLRLIARLGVDVCVVMRFNRRFAHLAPEDFIKRYLVGRIKARAVVVGDDFRFGWHRAGTIDLFSEAGAAYGFRVHSIGVKTHGAKVYSSTRIRQLIRDGDLRRAAALLGRPVSTLRRVIPGDGRGGGLGYPTANLEMTPEVIPPTGVYIVRVHWRDKIFPGIANIGCRPSFRRGRRVSMEVHLLDVQADLYGQTLEVDFLRRIRDEQMFVQTEDLVRRIRCDEEAARLWFTQHPDFL